MVAVFLVFLGHLLYLLRFPALLGSRHEILLLHIGILIRQSATTAAPELAGACVFGLLLVDLLLRSLRDLHTLYGRCLFLFEFLLLPLSLHILV